jgi:hypothetical protein
MGGLNRRQVVVGLVGFGGGFAYSSAVSAQTPVAKKMQPGAVVQKAAPPTMSLATQLEHTTSIIETTDLNGNSFTATSFAYRMFVSGTESVPVLVTNKHVFTGAVSGQIVLSKMLNGSFDPGPGEVIFIDRFESRWIGHPDPSIDLGIMPLVPVMRELNKDLSEYFIKSFDSSNIPTKEILSNFGPISDVLVIGYPGGLIDFAHNLPEARRGITASPAWIDFQGQRKFLIDCAIWPGSSGSPVLIYYDGLVPMGGGITIGSSQAWLAGINAAVFESVVDGKLLAVNIPPAMVGTASIQIPDGLGIVITSQVLLDFEPLLIKMGLKPPPGYKPQEN